ncbi:hypothetical protein VCUG_02437 [Vavraia culicis subsp. floridensis]|uniref:Uncharacterized protein n=1 Tax=Vavraia culicis (isolate floridensis) TaxID=948595 RepID=L2GSL1_VAVCU|nr:uncharacterized protein VCUG_02437 [Vavraia culicis subsp. floridensis]ELA46075.1 hypothetical protein VCUG_02437 [Vavraia culicis subsp. floridensis]
MSYNGIFSDQKVKAYHRLEMFQELCHIPCRDDENFVSFVDFSILSTNESTLAIYKTPASTPLGCVLRLLNHFHKYSAKKDLNRCPCEQMIFWIVLRSKVMKQTSRLSMETGGDN